MAVSPEFVSFLQVLTPIIVAAIGLRSEWNSKKNEKLKRLEQQEKEQERADLDKKFDELHSQLSQILTDTKEIHTQIASLKTQNELQDRAIKSLGITNRINGQYTHELAQLVTVLAEGMRDQHLDGNITRAIDAYRKFESTTLGSVLTGDQSIS